MLSVLLALKMSEGDTIFLQGRAKVLHCGAKMSLV